MQRVRSGRVIFVHTRQPTNEGKRVLPKLASQLASQWPQAADFVLSDLYIETISGEMTFRDFQFCIQARRQRDTSLAERARSGSAGGAPEVRVGMFVVGYDGRRYTLYNQVAGWRDMAEVNNEPVSDFADEREPALYVVDYGPKRWSDALREEKAAGHLKIVRVEGQSPHRVIVLRVAMVTPTGLNIGYQILHFAEEWGFMLRRQETYKTSTYAGKTVTWKGHEFRVERATELSPGAWFPLEMVTVFWSGELGAPVTKPLVPVAVRRTTFTVKEWNRPISDSALKPHLPPGTVVYSRSTGRYCREGYPLFGLPRTIGAFVLLVLLSAFLWWRFRRARTVR